MGAGSIFMVIISPPLIAISILCSCKKQLKILPSTKKKQTARKNDSNYKCSKKKAIIQDDLLASQLERSISSQLERSITSQLERSSFTNQNDQLLKKNDLQETKNGKSNFLLHEEQIEQLIVNDGNENESEFSALMVDAIIVFPSQLKWNLMNAVQRIKLKNPTENRFAIKVKCTNNDLYRVKPIFTFVEPKSFANFDVYRHDGIATVDHILFLTTSVYIV
uniref:Major sperm protein n=1 Tax=Onchocerca volvulus TaxID=6282 RepID=A0A8R1TZA5_ONCVO